MINLNHARLPTNAAKEMLYPWIIWLLGASFFFYKYLIQVSPSVMTHDLMQTFQVDGAGLGNLSACYFYAYLLMQIPVGIILDKFSPRVITSLAIFICAISTWLFSITDSLLLACISRAMMGLGAAFAAVSCMKSASLWFPVKRFALVSGMCMTAAMCGAVFGQMPLSFLVAHVGWRGALQWVALLGMGLSLLYYFIVQDRTTHRYAGVAMPDSKLSPASILTSKQAWLLSLYSGLAFAPVSVFGGLWGVPFLQQAYNLSTARAAWSVSVIFIGFAVGSPLAGWLSDHIGRRKPLMMLGTVLAAICLLIVIYSQQLSTTTIDCCLFLFGLGASCFFISFAMIREGFPLALAATVLGFMNTFDSICEAVSEPIVGILLDHNWHGAMDHGGHIFSTAAYHHALLLLPLYLVVAAVLLCFIQETYCQSYDSCAEEAMDTRVAA